ncbi:hypothetical protein [Haloferax chudinovii]|uniref:Uncharacterized protein n=1 Tax=Haloferax chudinovii TaxID=1109010 RepID=A0ABD5XNS4_9EURY
MVDTRQTTGLGIQLLGIQLTLLAAFGWIMIPASFDTKFVVVVPIVTLATGAVVYGLLN